MKTAVVTGGGSGIGLAVVERLRADGHRVAIIDLNAGEDEHAQVADVTDRSQIDSALAAVRAQLGPVSIPSSPDHECRFSFFFSFLRKKSASC